MKKPNRYLIDGLNGKHIKHLEHNTLIDAQMFCQAVKETTDKCIVVIDSDNKRRAIKIEDIKKILNNYSFCVNNFIFFVIIKVFLQLKKMYKVLQGRFNNK